MEVTADGAVFDDPIVKCGSCGLEGPWRTHSGMYECQACWDWRKLDSNASRYYYKLSLLFLSSVDTYDVTHFFPKELDLTPGDISTLHRLMKQIHEKTEALAEAHKTKDHWHKGAEEMFGQL